MKIKDDWAVWVLEERKSNAECFRPVVTSGGHVLVYEDPSIYRGPIGVYKNSEGWMERRLQPYTDTVK